MDAFCMKTVAMALFPTFSCSTWPGRFEVFSIADGYLRRRRVIDLPTVGTEPGPLRASNGVMVQADLLLEQADGAYDLLLVPGGPGAYNECHPALLPWLKAAAPRARRFGSICTGAFVLGHAGLFDEHRVTTHWHYTERLIKAFPNAIVETDRIYCPGRAVRLPRAGSRPVSTWRCPSLPGPWQAGGGGCRRRCCWW